MGTGCRLGPIGARPAFNLRRRSAAVCELVVFGLRLKQPCQLTIGFLLPLTLQLAEVDLAALLSELKLTRPVVLAYPLRSSILVVPEVRSVADVFGGPIPAKRKLVMHRDDKSGPGITTDIASRPIVESLVTAALVNDRSTHCSIANQVRAAF